MRPHFLFKLMVGLAAIAGFAQNNERQVYYAIENLVTGDALLRGQVDQRGIPEGEVILAAEQTYRLWMLDSSNLRVGWVMFTTPRAGRPFSMPQVQLQTPQSLDSDGDGLHDDGEFIIGTNANLADTDDDGIADGAELIQGLNPLDGLLVQTGIIATVPMDATVIDITTFNDTAFLADEQGSILVVNIFNGLDPVLIAQVPLSGKPSALHSSGRWLGVTVGSFGLTVLDVADPANAVVSRNIQLQGNRLTSVLTTDRLAYVGSQSGRLFIVDMEAGRILEQVENLGNINDVSIFDDTIMICTTDQLIGYRWISGQFLRQFSIAENGRSHSKWRKRIFAGESELLISNPAGFNTYAFASSPPTLVSETTRNAFGWKRVVANGSGLAITAESANSTLDGEHSVGLYDISDLNNNNDPALTVFPTPGVARSVSLYNGIAYVADNNNGLQVVNYLAYDAAGQAPSIQLNANDLNGAIEEGSILRVTALTNDDIQVRNVEFYLDGNKVATDGAYPFEWRTTVPPSSVTPRLTIRARVSDTGGNATWSDPLTFQIIEDATPPILLSFSPSADSIVLGVSQFTATFSEAIDLTTFIDNIELQEAGPDQIHATGDDVTVALANFSFTAANMTAYWTDAAMDLQPGNYQMLVQSGIADLAGNLSTSATSWQFKIVDLSDDTDQDGIPDEVEALIGLDPLNPDSDGDDIPDGDEDFDNDGLVNRAEILFSLDITNPDSDGDGITDGQEDEDLDDLNNIAEYANGTLHNNPDSDNDNWSDGVEVLANTDPLDPNSRPGNRAYVTVPGATAIRLDYAEATNAAPKVYIPFGQLATRIDASDVVTNVNQAYLPLGTPVIRIDTSDPGDLSFSNTLAQPQVSVEREDLP